MIPALGIANGGAFSKLPLDRQAGFIEAGLLLAALFGFEDEGFAAVEVDEVGRDLIEAVVEFDGVVEGVAVLLGIVGGGIGAGDFEEVAEFGEEDLIVGAFGCA